MMTTQRLFPGIAAALLATFLASPAVVWGSGAAAPEDREGEDPQDKDDNGEAAYLQWLQDCFGQFDESKSLLWDWTTIDLLARQPGVEVVPMFLSEMMRKPPKGLENRRYLLSSAIAARAMSRHMKSSLLDSEAEALLAFVRDDLRHPAWSWAAYSAALSLAERRTEARQLDKIVVDSSRPPVVRAALLLGFADAGRTRALLCVDELLAEAATLEDPIDRDRLREAVAWASAALCKPILGDDESSGRRKRVALECMAAVRDLLDEESLGARARVQVMRALQHAWSTKVAYDHSESWKLVETDRERQIQGGTSRTSVQFFGIPSFGGNRVLFLLDGSDSMLTPLTPGEKEALWTLLEQDAKTDLAKGSDPEEDKPRRGSRGRTRVGGSKSKSGRLTTISRRAWENVETRFDAARAHLKHTLALMDPTVEFAVILFGDHAKMLRTTPTFMTATVKSRTRVVIELDAIVPGRKDAAHPYGTLRGETNIYEALAMGFSMKSRLKSRSSRSSRSSRPRTRVVTASHPELVDACADTVYLLSDGMPTRDGFSGRTPIIEQLGQWIGPTPETEGEREVVINPETGATRKEKYKIPARPRSYIPGKKSTRLDETGPYILPDPLTDEVRRRNLFVKATLHVVAIGESAAWLGDALAKAGGGRCLRIAASGEIGSPKSAK